MFYCFGISAEYAKKKFFMWRRGTVGIGQVLCAFLVFLFLLYLQCSVKKSGLYDTDDNNSKYIDLWYIEKDSCLEVNRIFFNRTPTITGKNNTQSSAINVQPK